MIYGYIGEDIGVYFGMILPGKSVPGEEIERECLDGKIRKIWGDLEGWNGFVLLGIYCEIVVQYVYE